MSFSPLLICKADCRLLPPTPEVLFANTVQQNKCWRTTAAVRRVSFRVFQGNVLIRDGNFIQFIKLTAQFSPKIGGDNERGQEKEIKTTPKNNFIRCQFHFHYLKHNPPRNILTNEEQA